MRRRLFLLAGFTLAGLLFGVLDEHLPAPRQVGVFWVGNLSSTWVVLPFLAGWSQRTRIWAAWTGGITAVATVFGFYGLAFGRIGFDFFVPYSSFWILIAAFVGPAYGVLGSIWGESRSLVAGAAIGLPFVLEPWLWSLRLGHVPHPFPIWVVETAVGAALLAWVAAARKRRPVPTS
jgi:hypothetical protein